MAPIFQFSCSAGVCMTYEPALKGDGGGGLMASQFWSLLKNYQQKQALFLKTYHSRAWAIKNVL